MRTAPESTPAAIAFHQPAEATLRTGASAVTVRGIQHL